MRSLLIVLLSLLGGLSAQAYAQGAWRFLPDTVRAVSRDTILQIQKADALPEEAADALREAQADHRQTSDTARSVFPGFRGQRIGADTVVGAVKPDSTVQAVLAAGDSAGVPKVKLPSAFKPNPTKAVLLALVPGMGQIYNRKYWKLPIVYGAFMGCLYAVTWNNKSYQDYSEAYKDFMYDTANKVPQEDWHQSWQDVTNRDPETVFNDTNFADQLKRRKDYYRRYRDLSIIITVGVYALSIVDAYVDAQLFDFDITPDLSMRVEPVVTPKTSYSSSTYGVNCSIKF